MALKLIASELIDQQLSCYLTKSSGTDLRELHVPLSEPASRRVAFAWARSLLDQVRPDDRPRIKLDPTHPRARDFEAFLRIGRSTDARRSLRTAPHVSGKLAVCWPFDPPEMRVKPNFDPSIFETKNRLIEAYGDQFAWIREQKDFARWDGQRWSVETPIQDLYERLASRIEKFARREMAEADQQLRDLSNDADDSERAPIEARHTHGKAVLSYAAKMKSKHHYDGVKARIIEDRRIGASITEFDADPWLLNTPSGIVDLRTGRLMDHDPDKRCVTMTAAPYRADAKCPTFDATIEKICMGEKDLAHYMQLRFGSALCGKNPEQIAVLAWGPHGQGGKSTLFNAFENALGGYSKTASPDTFLRGHHVGGNRDDLTTLAGARIITTTEPDVEGVIDVGTFKRLTGGDKITAAGKYEKTRTIAPTWKIFLAANNFPAIKESGNPVWRRFEVMPFEYFVPQSERDSTIDDKLKAEGPGILAWLVRGCKMWADNGCTLELPTRARRALERYKQEADTVRAWLTERIEIAPDKRASAAGLYESYQSYCRTEGRKPVSKRGFGVRMTALDQEREQAGKSRIVRKKTDGRVVYAGIKLRAPR